MLPSVSSLSTLVQFIYVPNHISISPDTSLYFPVCVFVRIIVYVVICRHFREKYFFRKAS
jgi:hypothetical protein